MLCTGEADTEKHCHLDAEAELSANGAMIDGPGKFAEPHSLQSSRAPSYHFNTTDTVAYQLRRVSLVSALGCWRD